MQKFSLWAPSPLSSRPVSDESCPICGVTVRYRPDLSRHMKIHTDKNSPRSFKCPYEGCTYNGLQKSNLRTHLNTHTGEKPHACEDCAFAAADPGSLTRHKKKMHDYIPKRRPTSARSTPSLRHHPYERNVPSSLVSLEIRPNGSQIGSTSTLSTRTASPDGSQTNMSALNASAALQQRNASLHENVRAELAKQFLTQLGGAVVDSAWGAHNVAHLALMKSHFSCQFDAFVARYYATLPIGNRDVVFVTRPQSRNAGSDAEQPLEIRSQIESKVNLSVARTGFTQPANHSEGLKREYASSSPS